LLEFAKKVSGWLPRLCVLAFVQACLLLASGRAMAGELVTLASRPDATQAIFIEAVAGSPPWVIVLFAGDNGAVGLDDQGPTALRGNFLLRTAQYWLSVGDAIAIVDAPSDHHDGMNDAFRLSDEHLKDVQASVAFLRQRYPAAKLALIGTSRGTISVGNVLGRDPRLADAYVMTSPVTISRHGQAGLSGMRWGPHEAAVLVVSNENDACPVAPFRIAQAMAAENRLQFLAVSSADHGGSNGKCTGKSPHGYWGIESQVLDAVSAWLKDPAAVPGLQRGAD
jgi:hypothetical protein